VLRRAIRAVRRSVDQRAQAWIRRRQGPDQDPIVLGRQRIYILPTGYGLAYGTMVFSMLLGGMNYNNNLGLGLTFVLASLGLVAMHHCHGTLAGLRVRLLEAEPAFVGQEVCYRLLLENAARVPRPALELEIAAHRPPLGTVDVPAAGAMQADLRVPARRRGRLPLERFVIATRHPLGLFRAWAVIHPDYAAIAWPQPARRDRAPPLTRTDTGGAQDHALGDEDFTGMRAFQPGDSIRRIAWKAYARGQGLHTKQYAGTDVVSHVFDWDSLPGLDAESRLAQLCRWILDAHERGEAFGLRLPGSVIGLNVGAAHKERCLNELALFDAPGRPADA
jgi:uncharacterized protein (DUF58 family)